MSRCGLGRVAPARWWRSAANSTWIPVLGCIFPSGGRGRRWPAGGAGLGRRDVLGFQRPWSADGVVQAVARSRGRLCVAAVRQPVEYVLRVSAVDQVLTVGAVPLDRDWRGRPRPSRREVLQAHGAVSCDLAALARADVPTKIPTSTGHHIG